VPPLKAYAEFALRAEGKEMSTTMAAVRLFSNLLKDKTLGPRIVPIVADEARTFGMANLFRQVGIYSPHGQLYEPEDAGSMLYTEARQGQLLEGDHRGWRDVVLGFRRHVLQRPQCRDAALHIFTRCSGSGGSTT
jgi:pyruvate dehydrogenase complex dehydrogenase (E1) component